jgi:hypothetical protein
MAFLAQHLFGGNRLLIAARMAKDLPKDASDSQLNDIDISQDIGGMHDPDQHRNRPR